MPDTRVLRVERGERIVLSPDSPRFRENYHQIRPRTAAEVREVVGLSTEAGKALLEYGERRQRHASSSATVAVEDLESKDDVVRARALHNTGNALKDYVYAKDTGYLSGMEPAFVKYLENWQMVLKVAVLPDIEIADGGTMVVEDTHVVRANDIVIHGNGKIMCFGPTKFEANSIVGT